MAIANVGDRVIALVKMNADRAVSLGGGVFEGEFIPPAEISARHHALCIPQPRIKLDQGGEVWGHEVHWGAEDSVKYALSQQAEVNPDFKVIDLAYKNFRI